MTRPSFIFRETADGMTICITGMRSVGGVAVGQTLLGHNPTRDDMVTVVERLQVDWLLRRRGPEQSSGVQT